MTGQGTLAGMMWDLDEQAENERRELVALLTEGVGSGCLPSPWVERALVALDRLGPVWDSTADQQAPCGRDGCGHPYGRHFDGYAANAPVGCKYCGCHRFVPADVNLDGPVRAGD